MWSYVNWVLLSVAATAASYTVDCFGTKVGTKIRYVLEYDYNLEIFKELAGELQARKTDVQKKVDDAIDKNEEIKEVVLKWLAGAILIEMYREALEEIIEKNQGRCNSLLQDWSFLLRCSKFAAHNTAKIKQLLAQGEFNSVSDSSSSADLSDIVIPDFVPLKSSLDALDTIMQLLKEGKKDIIGVCGPRGVGKSTLMGQLVKHVDKITTFDKVYVTVAESSNLRRIQDEIAAALRFKIKGDTDHQRKANLSKALRNRRKKVLVILDDVRKELELRELGIPYGEVHGGCKMIVTSRNLDVLVDVADETIQIGGLDIADGVELFKKKAGLPDSDAFDSASKAVIIACTGLPSAITLVGRSLRHKPVDEWDDAIKIVAAVFQTDEDIRKLRGVENIDKTQQKRETPTGANVGAIVPTIVPACCPKGPTMVLRRRRPIAPNEASRKTSQHL